MSESDIKRISKRIGIPINVIEDELEKELKSERTRKTALDRTTQALLLNRRGK